MITVVSGLPRSGTSLMMQMLHAGGMPVLTDNLREPDANNPHGFLEHEKVKSLKKDNSWMGEAEGKVVKIVSHLLQFVDPRYEYRVIFMVRDVEEVVRSQSSMLERLGKTAAQAPADTLNRHYTKHLSEIKEWLGKQANFQVLYVNHREAVMNTEREVGRINEFLGGVLDVAKMIAIIKPALYRERRA
ncbi:MAG TPA: sulfotransferase domain-containing protein [Kiritimatiellia bacterium]|jgi:hypothetical protein